MKYRIRMSIGKWYVRVFDADSKYVGDIGPYKDIQEATKAAVMTGYDDYDKAEFVSPRKRTGPLGD
jgi:hypothetical protein